ncbi:MULTISPECIES: 3-hydroxybutyrate dehydrogenase [Sinorhizobium/Ensifer group]|uniref:3-hydroxybutyrate dehydrogenase n=1 Tax=Sinorhizobium/Ensifer group TaxID=227292 RepID=UPI00070D4057|nr:MULTISPECIES: 3-hydroxybutyrate dehydrogenase [Sinorhizobium/Ensifer group]KRD52779.1 3-hydroxybutyrate dehydrogenase [Ensifer sp. Root278]KSV94442.1 cytochrome C biogenesis protein CcmE [Sinorhizobium sp. GL28]MBD9507559.1 3-hydroxybutyrate dehydrogenase [Ensifer sp. ENS10]SDA85500.1 3-hydroxybutyrate dehydrogenase [Sinorhizobium sp. NFACC03]
MTKTAVITGSTSGIGLAIAKAFAKGGANIVLNGFGSPDEIRQATDDVSALTSGTVLYHGADMTKPAEIADLIATATEHFGSVDILVNNAGIQYVEKVEDFPIEQWDRIIAINLSSSFHTIRAAIPGMKAKGWGRIINIASAHGLVASPFKAAYVAAKHGVLGLTKTVALEVAENGITANSICPGYVLTPLVEKQIPDQARTRGITEQQVINDVMLKGQPTKKFITVEQVAALAVYLAGDDAAQITGTHVSMDGGWTAQ